jgi:hypothetical protein
MYDRARLFCLHARDVLRCFCLHWLLIRYAEPPTQEDLAHDNTCIVCRGDMVAKDAVKLPCRHSIHRVCLDRWIWKQLRCPTCRSDLLYQYGEIERQDRLARGKDPNDA